MTPLPPTSLQLRALVSRPWRSSTPHGVTLHRVFQSGAPDGMGVHIARGTAASAPPRATLKALWEERGGKSGFDVVIVVEHGPTVTIFGPDPDAATIELAVGQAQRQLQSVLDEQDPLAAYDRFGDLRRAVASSTFGGVLNAGLFARHYLDARVPARGDWRLAAETATALLPLRGERLIEGLGFTIRRAGGALLLSGGSLPPRAVAVLLDESETFDAPSPKHQLSPVAFGLREAKQHEVDWLVVLRGDRIRLYAGRPGVGAGQKGQTETYFELDLAGVDEDHAALLPLVFSADALEPQGSTRQILDGSARYATELGGRLRERIYERVVPPLARAVAEHLPAMGLQVDEAGLRTAYRVTLRILFRLLFQAYAEDRGLLPAGRNEAYDGNSLKRAAQRILHTDPVQFGPAATLWSDLEQVWDAIDQGNEQWMIPAYNGGLFNRDRAEGLHIARLRLPDSVMGPVLQSLLVDVSGEDVPGPVDFSSLSVREFGTIYEGLLESSLSLAETDLTYDKDDYPVPAGPEDEVRIPAGSAYFHSASGERKATGSYFTPAIVVDHLIERSIVPVLSAHLDRIAALLEAGDEVAAGREFFDFRVADLAMGSGHFLVAAIDRVEAMYRDFLTQHRVPRVEDELLRIHHAATTALGRDKAAVDQVENIGLLRRQVARRCIYGIDVNPLALELSRLALWIHTFVPGLPMSSFDHNLVCANSLTGIGTLQEALDALEPNRDPGQASFLDDVIEGALATGKTLLVEAANADEADKTGAREGARLRADARTALAPIRRVFDLAVAIRTGLAKPILVLDAEALDEAASTPAVQQAAERLSPAHMPYLFPEVFLRERPGFDVLLGNPPWEEVVVEESKFWAFRRPGLQRLPPVEMRTVIEELRRAHSDAAQDLDRRVADAAAQRSALSRGPFVGMGIGDVDLYKAFAWRNWQVTRRAGVSALVLPLSAWVAKGSAAWRKGVFAEAESDIAFFNNDRCWLFADVNPGYRITTTVLARSGAPGHVVLEGPYRSAAQFNASVDDEPARLSATQVVEADADACLPAFGSARDVRLWADLLRFPGLGDGRRATHRPDFRCAPAREIDVSLQGSRGPAYFLDTNSDHPVYNHLNVGVLQFDRTVGEFASANFDRVAGDYDALRQRTMRRADSAYSLRSPIWAADASTLPIRNPRIVFRDVVHASNARKVWVALAPANTLLTNVAPFLVFDTDDLDVQAYVLGVLSSGVVDWFGHLRINLHLNFFILYTLPVPLFRRSLNQLTIAALAGRLAVQAGCGPWDKFGSPVDDPGERALLRAELDALVWLEFGLDDQHLDLVFAETNPTRSPKEAVQRHLNAWKHSA